MFKLKNQQKNDGAFVSLTSDKKDFAKAKKSETIFLTAIVANCLNSLEKNTETEEIKRKAIDFLLKQKNDNWSFNYWQKNSEAEKIFPYPNDLDDTFCSLIALFRHDPSLLDGSSLAKIVTILTALEKKEGGPYKTWIVPENADEAWKDIDVAVNSNIAYFLALQDIFLPNLRKFLFKAIESLNIESKYYPTIYPVAYFLARYLNLDKKTSIETKNKLEKIILKNKKNNYWENPLNTALAILSLLELKTDSKKLGKSIDYLKTTSKNGRWKAYSFCYDPTINEKKHFAGSKALTTAFCLEAIYLFNKQKPTKEKPIKKDMLGEKIYSEVIKLVKKRFSKISIDLKAEAIKQLEKTLKKDKDKQIILMPYFFTFGLDRKVPTDFLIKLGMANLYGWIAYTIYDDFLDNEGKPAELSTANLCLRELATIFNEILPKKTTFEGMFQKIMDVLDNANTWEINHTRFKGKISEIKKLPDYENYWQLADKSIGHSLGPIAILFYLGFKEDSAEVKNFLKFFKHYIIARQLNDDAHDWEKDLKNGYINSVAVEILKECKNEKELQSFFWNKIFKNVSEKIIGHTNQAKKILDKEKTLEKNLLFKYLISSIEEKVQKGIEEQTKSVEFLKSYENL